MKHSALDFVHLCPSHSLQGHHFASLSLICVAFGASETVLSLWHETPLLTPHIRRSQYSHAFRRHTQQSKVQCPIRIPQIPGGPSKSRGSKEITENDSQNLHIHQSTAHTSTPYIYMHIYTACATIPTNRLNVNKSSITFLVAKKKSYNYNLPSKTFT